MTKALTLLTLCAFALVTSAVGSPIYIDDFASGTNDFVIASQALPGPTALLMGSLGANVLGGSRYLQITRTQGQAGANTDMLSANYATTGWLSLDADTSSVVNLDVWWNGGSGSGNSVPAASIGDLSGGNAITLSYISDQAGNTLTFRFYTSVGNYFTMSVPLTATLPNTPVNIAKYKSTADFTATGAPSWASIAAVEMSMNGAGTISGNDFRVDFLASDNVPEPATLVMIGSALLGLGLWRRKRVA